MTGIHKPMDNVDKPYNFEEMLDVVKKLSNKIGNPKYVRIDLYNINGKIYFGEYTFTPTGGRAELYPKEYEKKYGNMISI